VQSFQQDLCFCLTFQVNCDAFLFVQTFSFFDVTDVFVLFPAAIGELKIGIFSFSSHGYQSNPAKPVLPLGSQVSQSFSDFMACPAEVHKPSSLRCFVAGKRAFDKLAVGENQKFVIYFKINDGNSWSDWVGLHASGHFSKALLVDVPDDACFKIWRHFVSFDKELFDYSLLPEMVCYLFYKIFHAHVCDWLIW